MIKVFMACVSELPVTAAQDLNSTVRSSGTRVANRSSQDEPVPTSQQLIYNALIKPQSPLSATDQLLAPASSPLQVDTASLPNGLALSTTLFSSSGGKLSVSSPQSQTGRVTGMTPTTTCADTGTLSHSGVDSVGSVSSLGSVTSPTSASTVNSVDSGGMGGLDLQPMFLSPSTLTDKSSGLGTDLTSTSDGTDQLPGNLIDFPFMDWSDSELPDNLLGSSQTGLGDTDICMDTEDLPDFSSNLVNHVDSSADTVDILKVPSIDKLLSQSTTGSMYMTDSTSQNTVSHSATAPALCNPDLADSDLMDAANAMNIDVSDWLNVILPTSEQPPTTTSSTSASSSLNALQSGSSSSTSTFTADPILTPKTQDILALFNMDESDLSTPTDLGISFEKAMELSVSKS